MRFAKLVVLAVVAAPVGGFVGPLPIRKSPASKPLFMAGDISEAAKAALSSVPLYIAPVAAAIAGQQARSNKELLEEQEVFAEKELEGIRDKIKGADSQINTSIGVAVVSAGLIAANLFGGSARTTAPVTSQVSPSSTVTLEQIEESTGVLPESILTPLEEEAETSVEPDVQKTEAQQEEEAKVEAVTDKEEIVAEKSEIKEEIKEEKMLGDKPADIEEPANVFENLMKRMESAGKAGSEVTEAAKEETQAQAEAIKEEVKAQAEAVKEEAQVQAEVAKEEAQAEAVIAKEEVPAVEKEVETPLKEEEPANLLESLMKRMESAGQAGSEKAEVAKEEVQTTVETKTVEPTLENVEEKPKSEEPENVFESLMKRMEAAGQAGSEKIEAAKEEVQKAAEKVPEAITEQKVEAAPKLEEATVFEGLMKKIETAGQAGGEKVEAAKEDVISGSGSAAELVSPMANLNLPDNLGSTLLNGAAIAVGGAVGVSFVTATLRGRSMGSSAIPTSDAYLEGLTRSSSTLSKKSGAPAGYLDTLKSQQATLKTSGKSMGSAYLNSISKDSGALPGKSYNFANKKPGKTSVASSSPVAKISPSTNFRSVPTPTPAPKFEAPRADFNRVKEMPKAEIRPTQVTVERVKKEPEKVFPSPPAPSPVTTSYIDSVSPPASSTPPKTSYGPNKSYRVPSGGMGSSAGYLSNIAGPSSTQPSNDVNGINGSAKSSSKASFPADTKVDSKGSYLSGLTGDPVKSSFSPFRSGMSKSGDYGPKGYLDDL